MKRLAGLYILFSIMASGAKAQPMITNGDGSALSTTYCHKDERRPLGATPAGGQFSGCGMLQENGIWYFNPAVATQGSTVFPVQCAITYTAPNGQSVSRNILIRKPVVVHPPLQDLGTCIDSVRIAAQMLYAGAYDFQWSPAAPLSRPDTSVTDGLVTETTTFYLTATDRVGGCQGTDSITITRYPVPQLTVQPENVKIFSGQQVQLLAQGAELYEWFPKQWLSHHAIANPVASPQEPIEYTVVGYNQYGCNDTAKTRIDIEETLHLPNAFTPNGDGLNDFFAVKNMGYQGVVSFKIYDRWGHLIFETRDAAQGWDGNVKGRPAGQGVYFYDIRIASRTGLPRQFKGELMLMR